MRLRIAPGDKDNYEAIGWRSPGKQLPSGFGRDPQEATVQQQAVQILDRHRIMAISTVRPDGWPQTTIVGYANDGLDIFFLVLPVKPEARQHRAR